jgi:DNA-binding transcriptional LysR family regulator
MTLRQLQIFVLVATRLSVQDAADELRIAQPEVSRQLRLLQEELRQHLYRKVGNRIALTRAGEVLLREASRILEQIQTLPAKLSKVSPAQASASLTVGGSYSPSVVLLPSVLAFFKKTHPALELHLRSAPRLKMEEMIVKGEVELAVLHNPPSHRLLKMEPYRPEPMVAFAAPDHPLAAKKNVSAEDCRGIGFIYRKPEADMSSGRDYFRALRKQGFDINVAMECDSPEAVKIAVGRGMGVGILYKDVISASIRKGEFKALKLPADEVKTRSLIVYHKTRPLSDAALEFLKLLRTYRGKY